MLHNGFQDLVCPPEALADVCMLEEGYTQWDDHSRSILDGLEQCERSWMDSLHQQSTLKRMRRYGTVSDGV